MKEVTCETKRKIEADQAETESIQQLNTKTER